MSATIHLDRDNPHHIYTLVLMSMGQFIDHDISRTAVATLEVDDGGKIVCQSWVAPNIERPCLHHSPTCDNSSLLAGQITRRVAPSVAPSTGCSIIIIILFFRMNIVH